MDKRISIFYRQYLQQIQVEKLSFPPDSVLLDPAIQSQMFRYMFTHHLMFPSSEDSAAFLPPASYQKRVLKELTRRLEAAIRNPDDEVGQFPPFFLYEYGGIRRVLLSLSSLFTSYRGLFSLSDTGAPNTHPHTSQIIIRLVLGLPAISSSVLSRITSLRQLTAYVIPDNLG
jgi:hypothetical protein